MVQRPQGVFTTIPGVGMFLTSLTKVLPLKRGTARESEGHLLVE
ncbi:MAG: hypothetical protein WCF36_01235 [Candidatus Nanopelagicales bacterium]